MPDRPELNNGQIPLAPNERRELAVVPPPPIRRGTSAPDVVRELAVAVPQLSIRGQSAPNVELVPREFPFTGLWRPDVDPLLIGEGNYAVLQNLRYREAGLEPVKGYSQLNEAGHGTYVNPRSGLYFPKVIDGQTQPFLLLHAEDVAGTTSAVIVSTNPFSLPLTLTATPLWVDGAGAALGRFSLAPDGNMAYCNGVEATIWGTTHHRCAAFILTQATPGVTKDYTVEVQNTSGAPDKVAVLHIDGATAPYLFVGSTRPLVGLTLFVQTPNALPATLAVDYWGVGGWTAVANLADGTSVAGVTLAQTGGITFDSTVAVARVKFEQGYVLYFYRVRVSGPTSATTAVRHVTVSPPWQTVKDVWNGIEQPIGQFQVVGQKGPEASGDTRPDQTREVTEMDGVVAYMNDLASSNFVLAGFSTPQMGLRWVMKQVNTLAASATVSYWNGTAWAAVTNLEDRTLGGTNNSLGQTGIMSWTPIDPGSEFRRAIHGHDLYVYRVQWSANLGTKVEVDQVQGIPAPRRLPPCKFPFRFQNRLLLMGLLTENEGHAAEYCQTNAPDVWNGEDSSDRGQRLYFGDGGELTAAVEIYNRFAGSLAYLALVCKASETWVLAGNSPDSFQVFPLSRTIGCPSPLSMASAEVAYSVAEDAQRNIALWCAMEGPVLSDASVIQPIRGIEPYFDPNDTRYVNPNARARVIGWYDRDEEEYNLLLPSGPEQVVCNTWLVYDLRRQRWFEKVPATYLQAVIPLVTTTGQGFVFGTVDNGPLVRLETGTTWNGPAITQVLETGDLLAGGSSLTETRLRYLRLFFQRKLGAAAHLLVEHYADTNPTPSPLASVDLTAGTDRLVLPLIRVNTTARTHRLRLSLTTADAAPLWLHWAGVWQRTRDLIR